MMSSDKKEVSPSHWRLSKEASPVTLVFHSMLEAGAAVCVLLMYLPLLTSNFGSFLRYYLQKRNAL
jgi:hypothetical protein